jgi:hypothetical protein
VTGPKLSFTGKVIVKGPLIRTHFEIPAEGQSQLSEDKPQPPHMNAISDKNCIEHRTEQE